MRSEPWVSICIPAYNSEKFIEETLRSVLTQSYRNIEVVISDDCSVDNTAQIVNSFKDGRIRFFKNEQNLGVEKNWNKTLGLASGKYCKLMGADDVLYPTFIEEQVNILENPRNSDVVLVTSHKHVIDQDSKLIMTRKFPGCGRFEGITAIKKCVRRGTNVIGEPVAGLFRKEALEKSGYYTDENLYMIDLDLWSRMLKSGDLYVIDKVLYAFRISTQSLSTNIGFLQIKLFNLFIDKLYLDKSFNINVLDKIIAKTMALVMGVARNFIYLVYFKKISE